VQQITVHELASRLSQGGPVYLLDVRQRWEHETAALPNSILLPLDELDARRPEIKPPPGALVVAYCHHGIRSLSAVAMLEHLGLPGVFSLEGGIDAWSREIDPSVPRYR
jgi:adenylyltransferase/sulfurtransferase